MERLDGYEGTELINDKINEIVDWINNNQFSTCEHDYIPYPIDYVSSSAQIKMMCRKCLKVDYLQG